MHSPYHQLARGTRNAPCHGTRRRQHQASTWRSEVILTHRQLSSAAVPQEVRRNARPGESCGVRAGDLAVAVDARPEGHRRLERLRRQRQQVRTSGAKIWAIVRFREPMWGSSTRSSDTVSCWSRSSSHYARDRGEVVAPEVADVALHPALLVCTAQSRLAVERPSTCTAPFAERPAPAACAGEATPYFCDKARIDSCCCRLSHGSGQTASAWNKGHQQHPPSADWLPRG